jgi:transcriptional regulator of acetoin/glycerol metabolism
MTSSSRDAAFSSLASGALAVKPAARVGGLAAAPAPVSASRVEVIRQSHQRSAALGLSRGERRDYDPLIRSDLTVARERNQRLCMHAAPVMQVLFEQIVNTESMIVLTDAQGTILHSVGDDDFLERADKVALSPGENWAEHSKGTNAIGTALFEEAPTLVHAHEHFMHANNFLTCSAAPIFDPRGNVLGVLDVTGDHRGYHQHTMGLVRMSARMIENHWLSDDYNHRLRLHFHSRPEFIGTLLEGIIVVAPDGKVLGGNRSAQDQLGMSGAALRMQSVTSLFGTTTSAICDYFRAPLSTPMRLALPSGAQVHVHAHFDWPSRPVLGGLSRAEENADLADIESLETLASLPPMADAAPARDAIAPSHGADPRAQGRVADRAGPRQPASSGNEGLAYLCTGDAQVDLLVQKIRHILDRDIPLLILGETGTGKELLARAVHHESSRARQPFVAVNCASIPESLIEAELFGYEDGAFTGARRKGAPGRIVQAHGGTLFLDEIGDMPLSLQARLLRTLQERCVTPLGSTKTIPVDISVIGATHRNLRDMIEQHAFREDLYYRLNGLALRLPALRDRSDLEIVARRILQAEARGVVPELSRPVLELFRQYSWPGNIRQLGNVLRTAAALSEGERSITLAHLSDDFLEDVGRAALRGAAASAHAYAHGHGHAHTAAAARAHEQGAAAVLHAAALAAQAVAAERLEGAAGRLAAISRQAALQEGAEPAAERPVMTRTLEEAETEMIRATLESLGGNISAASKQLGISRNTIYRKLRWNVQDKMT